MKNCWHISLTLILLLGTAFTVVAQPKNSGDKKGKKIRVRHSDKIKYDPKVTDAAILSGNVELEQDGVVMRCDKAYLFEGDENRAEAFAKPGSKIRINQGDTLTITGDSIFFNGNERKMRMRGNIYLNDRPSQMTLTTKALDYDLKTKVASFYKGARIVSAKNNNTLTSEEGSYHSESKTLTFRYNVVLTNPEYKMESDTLHYNTASEVSHFLGPTRITSKENFIYCENGWYDTKNGISKFYENAYIITDEQKMEGDSIYYDRNLGYGEVFRNVVITDTVNNYLINGDYAIHHEKSNESLVTGDAMMTQINDNDSLFLRADTLYSSTDSIHNTNIIRAYNNVRFFKQDLQGRCDSLSYNEADSLLKLYENPVLWSEQNQLTGSFIEIKNYDGITEKIVIYDNAFIISEADTIGFNQIKGKTITGYLDTANNLRKVFVEGNGQTVYYLAEEDSVKKEYIGMNRSECSDILVFLNENQVEKITFIEKPELKIYPMNKINPKDRFLKNFAWRKDRPLSREDLD